MKLLKPRDTPVELRFLRMLRARMTLPDDQHYLNLEQGYAGERIMDAWLENVSSDCLVINDLLLEQNRRIFQIDSLLVFQEKIYMLDAKHSAGDFYIDGDKWKTITGVEIQDPLLQMRRSTTLLRKLLQQLRINIPIEYFLVFTHPEFYLYSAPPDLPAVFTPQVPRFLKQLNRMNSKINRKHEQLAKQLLALHSTDNPHMRLPEYDFDGLEKGVVCAGCRSFMQHRRKKFFCSRCGMVEDTETAVMRSVAEYRFLFPDRKVTTKGLYEWGGMQGSSQKVRQILLNHFKRVGDGRSSYYVD